MRYSFEIEGIRVNPALPENFDCTPNEERTDEEIKEWWSRPYILIVDQQLESWIEYRHRMMIEYGDKESDIETRENWEKIQAHSRKIWLDAWPTGFRYTVRTLDGGAWDRSTNKGSYATFDEALQIALSLSANSDDIEKENKETD